VRERETMSGVENWREALAASGELAGPITDAIISTHGSRGARAIEAVSEGRVKQYRDFTVVVGHRDEYIVEGGGCTCKDSEYNLDPADPDQRCWHALAVDIAERVGEVDHHDMWYSDVREFL
jgi:predicted nucleic acid-binding Zn finger protein